MAPSSRAPSELETFTRKVAIVFAFVLGVAVLWLARGVVLLVFIAAVLAAGIAPAVRRVRVYGRLWTHRRVQRGTAVLLVYLPFLLLIATVAALTIPRLLVQSQQLATQLPVLIEQNILTPLEHYVPMHVMRDALFGQRSAVSKVPIFFYVKSTVQVVASVVAILFMIGYMLIDAERLRNLVLLFYEPEERAAKRRMLTRMAHRMSSWLSGQLILAAIIGVATFVGLLCLRIPYAIPLALLAAVGEMMPVIGPIVGAIPSLIIALLHSPWQFWSVLAMAILFQKAENLFIAPRVMSKKVSMSPLAVFIAFLLGASLLGIIGAILAIPVAAIVQVTFDELFVARRERRQDFWRAGTLTKERKD
jgi:predicted PurR-regulated permease PerM